MKYLLILALLTTPVFADTLDTPESINVFYNTNDIEDWQEVTAYTTVGNAAYNICVLGTPKLKKVVYAPSETVFARSNQYQFFGCKNWRRRTYKRNTSE